MKLFGVLAVGLMLAVPVSAQDYDKGSAAYDAGDFMTALQEWLPLAEQGDLLAEFYLKYLFNDIGNVYLKGDGVLQDHVASYMWFNIGAANGDTYSRRDRDDIAKLMTPADISEAQRRARVCMASNYQDCD